ncbi:hypothetical protein AAG570_002560 [Ranatra chinensis]|uniref:Hexamerin n=1 Tax=Ranatra chinensis TaxID=642074 RepID=A0ABD0Y7X0_9HEMI
MFGGVVLSSHDSPFSHLEERLSYFREDVGLNDYLAQMALLYPTWMDTAKYPKVNYFRRGELYYYMVQQVYARYAMERTANFLPKTEMLMWDHPIKVGYNPRTTTPHGRPLLPRANYMVPKEFNPHGVWKVERIERIVLDALDSGLLYNLVPSAMATLLVMSRDPAFYQLLHRLINIFQHHKEFMPCYTKKELSFPSVKIDTLDVGPLATYFDYFDMSVTNGIPIPAGKDYKDYHYTMRQRRLNHKSFTYKMSISSDENIDAMIRVFIGPKYDSEERPLTLEQARMGFVEIDRFPVKLSSGENMIERNSKESAAFTGDQESFAALYKRVETCITTKEPFYVTESFHCGLPERFMLPKGWHSGFTYQMFVIATPFDGKASSMAYDRYLDNYVACGGPKYYDGKPYGFPFDRRIDYKDVFHQANSIFKDVKIYHKDESDLNRPEHQ